jgi:hypothetical protein
MSWATRRRFFIVVLLALIAGGLVYWYYVPVIYKAPLCTDGVMNGTETGIDCGGTMCSTLCRAEVQTPSLIWARSFPVTDTVYNAAAYIENKNNAGTRTIAYEFRLYDEKDILAARVSGTTIIPPLGRYAIVETGIPVGTARVKSTEFSFGSTPAVWERVPEAIARLRVSTSSMKLDTASPIPKLSATITNSSPTVRFENTVVATILYDADDNAVNVSRTILPVLGPGMSAPVFFTWPRPFSSPVVRYDIVPVIDVFLAK